MDSENGLLGLFGGTGGAGSGMGLFLFDLGGTIFGLSGRLGGGLGGNRLAFILGFFSGQYLFLCSSILISLGGASNLDLILVGNRLGTLNPFLLGGCLKFLGAAGGRLGFNLNRLKMDFAFFLWGLLGGGLSRLGGLNGNMAGGGGRGDTWPWRARPKFLVGRRPRPRTAGMIGIIHYEDWFNLLC